MVLEEGQDQVLSEGGVGGGAEQIGGRGRRGFPCRNFFFGHLVVGCHDVQPASDGASLVSTFVLLWLARLRRDRLDPGARRCQESFSATYCRKPGVHLETDETHCPSLLLGASLLGALPLQHEAPDDGRRWPRGQPTLLQLRPGDRGRSSRPGRRRAGRWETGAGNRVVESSWLAARGRRWCGVSRPRAPWR